MGYWGLLQSAEAITCERSLSLQALLFLHFSHRVFGRFNEDTEAPYDDAEEDVTALALCPD
jgi:hypothetical protein